MKSVNLLIELPDDCAYLERLKGEIKTALKSTGKLESVTLVCSRNKMLAEISFSAEDNLVLKAEWLIYDTVKKHHPIAEGEKVKVKIAQPRNRFETIEFQRKNGVLTAHVYAGPKGNSKKVHIFREPNGPQRFEESEKHFAPIEGFEHKGEYYHSIVDIKNDFHACILVEIL